MKGANPAMFDLEVQQKIKDTSPRKNGNHTEEPKSISPRQNQNGLCCLGGKIN